MDSGSGGKVVDDRSFSDRLRSSLRELRGKKEGIIISMIAAGAISSVVLFLLPVSILAYLIIAFVGFLLPYYMGLKRTLHILIYGVVLMLVLSFVFAGAYTHYVYLSPSSVIQDSTHNSTTGNFFKSGSVTPVQGSSSTVFTFTAAFNHPANITTAVPIFVTLVKLFGSGGVQLNTTMVPVSNVTLSNSRVLTTYSYSTTLPSGQIYLMQFKSNSSGTWVLSTVTLTPRTIGQSSTFITLIEPSILVVFLSVSTLFFGLALVVLLIRQTRTRREQIAKAREQQIKERVAEKTEKRQRTLPQSQGTGGTTKKEKFVCTSCGTEVSRDDSVCPKCGEKFE